MLRWVCTSLGLMLGVVGGACADAELPPNEVGPMSSSGAVPAPTGDASMPDTPAPRTDAAADPRIDAGTLPGCRSAPTAVPDCAYEPPLLIDDDTPAEAGVVVIRDRCFRQPETVSLTADGTQTEPAIRIQTERPVLLENVVTVSAGSHVVAEGFADVTIRGSAGYGLEPTVDDVPRGNYLVMEGFRRVVVERSFLSHTRGLQLWSFHGGDDATRVLQITGNVVRNVDGRCRNLGSCGNTGTYQFGNFVGFNDVTGSRIEIGWNDVSNEPGESSVEDNLGLYRASGLEGAPLRVHDNAIRGGYPFPVGANYTGSCFTTDGDAQTVGALGFVLAEHNLCVSVGLNIAGGHDMHYRDNRYVSAGQLPDGTALQTCFWCVGGIFDYYGGGNLVNDSIEDLRVALPAGVEPALPDPGAGNTVTVTVDPEPATLATEQAAYQTWCEGAAAAGIVLGP